MKEPSLRLTHNQAVAHGGQRVREWNDNAPRRVEVRVDKIREKAQERGRAGALSEFKTILLYE